jgi:hypothetical protein
VAEYEFALAEAIVDSDPVIGVYAACEWDCLSDDGKVWIAAIVAEAVKRSGTAAPQPGDGATTIVAGGAHPDLTRPAGVHVL